MKEISLFQNRLLNWYQRNHRDLPWRRTKDPYKIWVSEVMLQQTQVATVIPYYERWIERFPTPQALADASTEEVLKAWEGLGYYSRARNLHSACREIIEQYDGRVPDSLQEIQQLPGIGRYTAGAILSMAYDQAVPVVDGNVQRVLSRLYAIWRDPKKSAQHFWKLASSLVPKKTSGDFNQALMELGATLCTPTHPSCLICPVQRWCQAQKKGIQDQLPMTTPREKNTPVYLASALIQKNDQVLLCQRPSEPKKGHLAGLWELPTIPISSQEEADQKLTSFLKATLGIDTETQGRPISLKTSRTHFRLHFQVFKMTCIGNIMLRQDSRIKAGKRKTPVLAKLGYPSDMSLSRWIPIEEIAHLPLPGVWAKLLRRKMWLNVLS